MAAPTIDELVLGEEPAAWTALGFTLEGEVCRLGDVRVRLAGRATGRGIVGWSLRGLQSTALDGLPTSASERPLPEGCHGGAEHPNGVRSIDHVVAFSPALDRSVVALEAAGLDLRRVREEPTPAGAPRQAFFRLGREILELVQEPVELARRAGGADRPARFWGLALLAEDLDRTVQAFGGSAGEIRPAVQPGRRIATVSRAAGLAVPLALMSPDERLDRG